MLQESIETCEFSLERYAKYLFILRLCTNRLKSYVLKYELGSFLGLLQSLEIV